MAEGALGAKAGQSRLAGRFLDIHRDLSRFALHRESRLREIGDRAVFSRCHIKLEAMPWTCHCSAAQLSFAERASLVGADPIEGVNLAVDIVERNDPIPRDSF